MKQACGTWVIVKVVVEDKSPGGVCLPAQHRHDTREGVVVTSGENVAGLVNGSTVTIRTTDVLPLGGGMVAVDYEDVIATEERS